MWDTRIFVAKFESMLPALLKNDQARPAVFSAACLLLCCSVASTAQGNQTFVHSDGGWASGVFPDDGVVAALTVSK